MEGTTTSAQQGERRCVLLATRRQGLGEGIRDLLATAFDSVVVVGDEASLWESAERLRPQIAVVDLALGRGGGVEMLHRLHARFPQLGVVVLSVHATPSVARTVLAAVGSGFVAERDIATNLLPTVEALLAAQAGAGGSDASRAADGG